MRRRMDLREQHLADLHQRARELEVPRFRMLARDELIQEIEERGGASDEEEEERAADSEAAPEEAASEEVTGVLDRMPQGYGFLRLSGTHEGAGDIYVSASQIRRCEL